MDKNHCDVGERQDAAARSEAASLTESKQSGDSTGPSPPADRTETCQSSEQVGAREVEASGVSTESESVQQLAWPWSIYIHLASVAFRILAFSCCRKTL